MTPDEIFRELPKHLDQTTAKGLHATIQFNLTGEDGGHWYVTVKDGQAAVHGGTASAPNMTMSMTAQDYVDLSLGKLNRQMAFMSGKLMISGDVSLAMKTQTLFRPLR
jgi:putative sterol carrier protein